MAPHRTSIKVHAENAKKLLGKNRMHHNRAANHLHHGNESVTKRRIIALRKGHFEKLKRLPFFNRLMERKEEIAIEHKGRHEKYTILLNGLQVGKKELRAVVLIDPKMRGILFFRASSEKLGPFWTPIKSIIKRNVDGEIKWIYTPMATKISEYPFYEKLSGEIMQRENHIDFSRTYKESRIAQIRTYL